MKRQLCVLMALCVLLCGGCAADIDVDGLTVVFFDVGKADATLIYNGEMAVLIDAGENGDGKDVAEALMAAVYLEEAAKTYMAARPFKTFQSFDQSEIEHARYEADRYGQVDVE